MENSNNSVFSRLMSMIFIAMGIFLGIYAFFANATSWQLDGGYAWNNNNFLTSNFWSHSPTSGDIIIELYGSGDEKTAYTNARTGYTSGSCITPGIDVVYLTGGLGTIPNNLSGNTIYVLNSGNYLITGQINFNENCTALIGNGNVRVYSTGYLNTGMLYASGVRYIIMDNIYINGTYGGLSSIHTENDNETYDGLSSIHTENDNAIRFNASDSTSINNIKTYNSLGGIYYDNMSFSLLNNVLSFNNTKFGIKFFGSYSITTNNSSTFNNGNGTIIHTSTGIVINNLSSLSNSSHGIAIIFSQNNVLQGVDVLNNGGNGIYIDTSIGNIFYGKLNSFDNTAGMFFGTTGNDLYLIGGTGTYFSSFGRATGSINTVTGFLWNNIINPCNSTNDYLLSRFSHTIIQGPQARTGEGILGYSIGESFKNQTQPVVYSGTNLLNGGGYDMYAAIGNEKWFTYNYITTIPSTYNTTSGITINQIWMNGGTYNVFGDITTPKTGTLLNSIELVTGLFLSGGDGVKFIFSQFQETFPTTGITTHYGTSVILDAIPPAFTGTTLDSLSSGNVISGEYYNTGIIITFYDANISVATLSGAGYTDGTLITGNGTHVFIVQDIAGNSTGMTFTIDTIIPTLTGVISGTHYNHDIIITGSDIIGFSGFYLSGTRYVGNSLLITGDGTRTVTGYDKAGNTTRITFTIDKFSPVFTGTTLSSLPVLSGGYYNTSIIITYDDMNISGATLSGLNGNTYYNNSYLSGAIITTGGTYRFTIFDLAGNSTGMTFTIDTINPLVTVSYPTSGLHISGINSISFSRTGWDNIAIDTYTLSITGTQIYTGTTTANTSTIYLPNGSYTRYVTIKDRAGNTGISQMFPLLITTPYSGNITLTGPNAKYIGTQRFTKDRAGIYMLANDPSSYSISGNIYASPLSGTFTSRVIHSVLLTGTNGAKDIFVTMNNGSGGIISKTFLVQLDTLAPTPTLTSPVSGANIAGAITLSRSAGADAAGLSGYQYFISPTDTFGTIFHSGFTTTSSVTIPNGTISYTGILYRKVIFIDRLGNTGSSTTQSFNYTGGVTDTIPNSFHFNDVTNADLDEIYVSNTITITGMTANTPVLASINRGALYISGNMIGTTGYVQNGWTVKIELTSSNEYDDEVSSTLTIGGVSDTFKVTTKEGTHDTTDDYEDIDTELSNTEKLMVIAIFETLKDVYAGDKEEEFFNTMMLMLEEKMDEYDDTDDEYIALKYLYDIIEQYYDEGDFSSTGSIDIGDRITDGLYTAPNGKKYTITYDSATQRFTSTNFVVPKYFPTLDTLKYIIDINNPAGSQYANAKPILARWKNARIDGTRQTSPYTAPNRKAFYFFKDIYGKYSSYTFTTERYFDSLNDVKEFIYNSNR